VQVRFSGLFTEDLAAAGRVPHKIVVGFLEKYRLDDFPTTICEEPD
jgi:hypothetical protein